MRSRRPATLLALLAIPALLLAACAGSGATALPAASAGPADRGALTAPGYAVPEPASVDAKRAQSGPGGEQTGPGSIPVPQAFDPERALILTASVSLEAKDPWSVSDQIQAIAAGLGGDVLALAQSGSGDRRTATLTVRVPQAQFNDALRRIRDIADVEVLSSNVQGQDVTDQFVDLQARLAAKQAEEQRYLALLARADRIDDILKIDATLSQVRTQIEQLTGQINSIKARTTYSTITAQVSPIGLPVPTIEPSAYDPSKTAQRAFAALAAMMRGVLDVAIWALVFGWLPLLALALALLVSRTRSRPAPTA